jgi:hypothetical protein
VLEVGGSDDALGGAVLAPEAPGLDAICRGLSMVADDDTVLALTGPMFDGLYEHCRRALLSGRAPS